MKKRLLSLVLCLVMVFSLFPAFGMNAAAAATTDYYEFDKASWTAAEIASGNAAFLPTGVSAEDTEIYYYDAASNQYFPVRVGAVALVADSAHPLDFSLQNFPRDNSVQKVKFHSDLKNTDVEVDVFRSGNFVINGTEFHTLYYGCYDHSYMDYYEYFPFYYDAAGARQELMSNSDLNYYTAANDFNEDLEWFGKSRYYNYDGWLKYNGNGYGHNAGDCNALKYPVYRYDDSAATKNLIYYSSASADTGRVPLAYNANGAASLTDMPLYYKATLESAAITASNTDVAVEMGTTASVNLTFTGCTFARVETGNAQVATADYNSETGVLTITPVSVDETVITVYGTGTPGHMTPAPLEIHVTVNPDNYVPPVLADGNYTDNDGKGNIFLSKELQGSDDTYKITMEAYSTGEKATETTGESKPTDIILVLDQSGSMDYRMDGEDYSKVTITYQELYDSRKSTTEKTPYVYRTGNWFTGYTFYDIYCTKNGSTFEAYYYDGNTRKTLCSSTNGSRSVSSDQENIYHQVRLDALKEAVTDFVDAVAQKGGDIKIGIVGFAGNGDSNNEWFNGYNSTPYSSKNSDNDYYTDYMKSPDSSDLLSTISTLGAEGGTKPENGLDMAIEILKDRPSGEERNAVIVFFTDGAPGEQGADESYATAAISKANTLKNTYGATVYCIGVFSGEGDGQSIGSYDVLRYMENVSSKYPEATSLADRGNVEDNSKEYYQMVSGTKSLAEIFDDVSQEVSGDTTTVTLGPDSQLRDGINTTNFTTPVADDVKVYTVPVQVVNGEVVEVGARTLDENNAYPVSVSEDGVVSVTNFDYSANYVTETKEGLKLIVEITNLKAKVTGDQITSNVAEPSTDVAGIYAPGANHPTAMVDLPWVNIHPASPITADAELDKHLNEPDPDDGTYSITLDAYAKGNSVGEVTYTSTAPVDVVIVVDNSGSMFDHYMSDGVTTRNAKVVSSINQFVGNLSGGDARVAIVRGGRPQTVKVYNGSSSGSSSDIQAAQNTDQYFKSARTEQELLLAESNQLQDKSNEKYQTYLNSTFDLVKNLLNKRTDTSRKAMVIFFSDGQMNFAYSAADSEGLSAVKAVDSINNVDIFTAYITTTSDYDQRYEKRMQGLSSEYPNATYDRDIEPGSPVGSTHYYQMVKTDTVSDFGEVFDTITQTIGSDITLDTTAYLEDIIDLDNFDVVIPEGSTKPVVVVETVDGTADYLGNVTFDETTRTDITADVTVTYDVTTNAQTGKMQGSVKVTDFDFSEKHIAFGHDGKKLVVTIKGLMPKHAGTEMPSNVSAGVYDADGTPAQEFNPSPTATVGTKTYVIDFNAPMILATDAKKANQIARTDGKAANGEFYLDSGNAVYKLKKGDVLSDGANLVLSGVDKAMVFGKLMNELNPKQEWTEVTTVPASSVYFDDDLTTPKDVGDGHGYADIQATSPANNTPEEEMYTYTFTGTGIDVYCTTHSEGAYVQAKVTGADDKIVTNTKGEKMTAAMKNYAVHERYNTPTFSFRDLAPDTEYKLVLYVWADANYKFDGIRVYNSISDQTLYTGEIDNEANASYTNLRGLLVNDTATDFNYDDASTKTSGILFVDDTTKLVIEQKMTNPDGTPKMVDGKQVTELVFKTEYEQYKANSPKNEIYLDRNQGIAFTVSGCSGLNDTAKDNMYIGMSTPKNETAEVKFGSADDAPTTTVSSGVDMYYKITPVSFSSDGDVATFVIINTSDAEVALTNLKISGNDKAVNVVANNGAIVLSAAEEPQEAEAVTLRLEVNETTLRVLSGLTEDNGASEDPGQTEEPADPTPEPTQQPSLVSLLQQLFSEFVKNLFGSISRLFGN